MAFPLLTSIQMVESFHTLLGVSGYDFRYPWAEGMSQENYGELVTYIPPNKEFI